MWHGWRSIAGTHCRRKNGETRQHTETLGERERGAPVTLLVGPAAPSIVRPKLRVIEHVMSEYDTAKDLHSSVGGRQTPAVPDGYRQGLITAITVLLGFSLTFLRFWGFEAPGHWTLLSTVSTGISILAVVLQLVALFRSLRLEDQVATEYQKTVRWFISSAIALLVGLSFAVIESVLEPT